MHVRHASVHRGVVLAIVAGAASFSQAADIFTVTGTATNVPTVNVGGSSIIDLIDDAVNTQNQFAAFQNAESTFRLNYGGVADAITVTKNAGNTSASITLLGQPTRTFTGTSQADLENQIEDYLKKEGASDLTNFFKEVNKRSVIGVSDGNPNSTTARMAQFSYNKFGFFADQFKAYSLRPSDAVMPMETGVDGTIVNEQGERVAAPEGASAVSGSLVRSKAGLQFSLAVEGNSFEVGAFEGNSATISSSLDFNFSERVGLSLGSFVGYNSIEDADVFHAAFTLGVPVRIVLPDTNASAGITWQVTPHAVAGGSGSEDVGAGGLVYGFGITNYLAWHINSRWTLGMANQYSMYEGEELEFDDFKIDPGVDQSMLKNGLRATYRISEQWYAFGGGSYTNYLDDAAVENWFDVTAGVGYSTRAGTGVQLGVNFADGDAEYSAIGGRLSLTLAF